MTSSEPARAGWRLSPLLRLTAALHGLGLAGLLVAPAKWRWVAGTLLLNHLAVSVAGMWPRSQLLGPNLVRLPSGQRRIALTFDDGPDPDVTPAVLDLLDERRARASFFCIGRRAAQHPGLAGEIVRRGHRLENHTDRHPNTFAFYGPRAMGREIDRAQAVLEEVSGRRPVYFRAPAGIRNPWLDTLLLRRGLTLASWTRRGFDTVEKDPAKVCRRLARDLADGDVVLLHDGSAARDRRGRPVVLEALPRFLDAVEERGLRAEPLPDLPPGSAEASGSSGPAGQAS